MLNELISVTQHWWNPAKCYTSCKFRGLFFFSLPFNLQRMKYYTFTEAERRHLPSPVTYWGTKNDAESRGFWCDPPPQSFWTWRFPTHRSCLLVAGKNYHSPRSQLRVLTGLVTSSSTAQPLSPFPSLFFLLFLLCHRQLGTQEHGVRLLLLPS